MKYKKEKIMFLRGVEYKKCPRCKRYRAIYHFYKKNGEGIKIYCDDCMKEISENAKKWRKQNEKKYKEYMKAYMKKYYQKKIKP